jgi:hypothetical protein
MNKKEIYESAARTVGDLAGVFEFDGETSFFYLYKISGDPRQKVIGAIHIVSGAPDFEGKDITILWDRNETAVGLFVRSKLWAVFDNKTGIKHGGNYNAQAQPNISSEMSGTFESPTKT